MRQLENERTLLAGVSSRISLKKSLIAAFCAILVIGMFGILFAVIFIYLFPGTYSEENSVYNPDTTTQFSLFDQYDFVKILTFHNIYNFTKNSDLPSVVLFYSVYCGGCKLFSPTYKTLAALVSHWDINVGALSCVSPNTDVCSKMEVSHYPYIRIIKPNSELTVENSEELPIVFNKSVLFSLLSDIATYLMNMNLRNGKTRKLEELTTERLTKFYNSELVEEVIIIFSGFTGYEKLMGISFIDVYKCSKVDVSFVPPEKIRTFPVLTGYSRQTVVAIESNRKIKLLASNLENNDYAAIRAKLSEEYSNLCPELINPNLSLPNGPQNKPTGNKIPTASNLEFNYEDVVKGLGISLRSEISMVNLESDKFNAVKSYLDVLLACFPWMSFQKEFLQDTRQWLISQNGTVQKENFRKLLKSERALRAFPTDISWNSCKGTDPSYRGFPCSMWILFHAMVSKCEKPDTASGLTGIDVLLAVKGYVTNFFMCLTCRMHFEDMSQGIEKELKTPIDAIKWLWVSHNKVNARIAGSSTEDPSFPKIQFPLPSDCPDCHEVKNIPKQEEIVINPGYNAGKHSWNFPSTISFLRVHYSVENMKIPSDFLSRYGNNTDDEFNKVHRQKMKNILITLIIILFLLLSIIVIVNIIRSINVSKFWNSKFDKEEITLI